MVNVPRIMLKISLDIKRGSIDMVTKTIVNMLPRHGNRLIRYVNKHSRHC
jgi:hypothetical protein